MKHKIHITIGIPVYNEEANIKLVIDDCLEDLPRYFQKFEIIVVDDGSTDKTGEICDRLAERYKQIKVIHQSNTPIPMIVDLDQLGLCKIAAI